MVRIACCLATASLALWAGPALAEDVREVEVFSFTHRIDFSNEPVGNRFVIVKRGELHSHPVLRVSSARRLLHELRVASTDLERALMGGREIPVELIKAQAPGLFGRASKGFELESLDVRGSGDEALQRVERALTQQYEDHVLLETLAHLCERDWKRIREHARQEEPADDAAFSWTVPGLYRALRFAQTPAVDGLRTITISGAGVGPESGTGARSLRGFEFVGQLDDATGRFRQVDVSGTVRNVAKRIELALSYSRTLERVETIRPSEAADYDRTAASLARAVHLAARKLRANALKAYEALVPGAGVERFRSTSEEFFAKVRRAAQGVRWDHTALEPALAEAQETGKPILLLFDQDGCPACTLLERGVLTSPDFVSAVDGNFVTVRLNACTDAEVGKRFALLGTPTLIVLAPDGTEVSRQVGARSLASGLRLLQAGISARVAPAPGAPAKAKKYF